MASRLRTCPRCIRSVAKGQNHNFFANELSNYVSPSTDSLGSVILFGLVSTKPTLVVMNDMAEVTQTGATVTKPKAPDTDLLCATGRSQNPLCHHPA
jgi:hypothetical protein